MDWATRKRTVRKLCTVMKHLNQQVSVAAAMAQTLSDETASHLEEPAARLREFERQINMVRSVIDSYTASQIDEWIRDNSHR